MGTWMSIFELTAAIAVITNGALICYTMDLLVVDGASRVWIFLCFQYCVFLTMYAFRELVDDVTEEVCRLWAIP